MRHFTTVAAAVTWILDQSLRDLQVATPLGLGKPNQLINALYDRISQEPSRAMTLYTALSLNPPRGRSDLEKRFLKPFTDRLYGKNYPRLRYVDDRDRNALPPNIHIEEFYMQSGALLGSGLAQQHYASINYTHVARALSGRNLNLMVQKVAVNADGEYSLSCNNDLTLDTLAQIKARGGKRPLIVGEVDTLLPWVGGNAVVPADFFDAIVTPEKDYEHLFVLPRQPVGNADYAIGFYASTLIRDGGTLQIGIGALADAVSYALVLRHTDNATYREILRALDPDIEQHPLIREQGGLEPFRIGLYGCSEMINEGFRLLAQHGILKRRVVDDLDLMRRQIQGNASPEDLQRIDAEGQFLHGAFYLGSPDFYAWLGEMSTSTNALDMKPVSEINEISGMAFERESLQRQHARFLNTCMMATMLGGAASETLPDGRVVSGVGGQFNFVSMGHSLPNARSILMLRAVRTVAGHSSSSILPAVENLTIPRHLRDVFITEYGIADLRDHNDAECIRRMIAIADQQFQPSLLSEAQSHLKLPAQESLPQRRGVHTAAQLTAALLPFRQNGALMDYPIGSDFTEVEERLVKALGWLKENTSTRSMKARTLLQSVVHALRDEDQDRLTAEALERMGLAAPESMEEKLMAEMLEIALEAVS